VTHAAVASCVAVLALASCAGKSGEVIPRAHASGAAMAAPPEASAAPAPVASSPAASASAAVAAPPPREHVEALEVPGFPPAVVVTPSHDRPAPVVIVAHGAGGRPEPHCDRYRQLVKGRAFILCTRGRASNKHLPEPERGYFYDGHPELGKEVRLALAALGDRYGARVDLQRTLYGGYSQGATMGILYLQQGGAPETKVAGVLLVEGGAAEWTVGVAKKLASEGVRKVAIVCGQVKCARAANTSRPWLEKGGLAVRVSYAQAGGHTYGGDVAPLVEAAFAWLIEGDERFGL
jgi:hypothetical protein